MEFSHGERSYPSLNLYRNTNGASKTESFLSILVHDISIAPGITGLCVGYERGTWRYTQFAEHILEWIPEFALRYSEAADIRSGNAVQLVRNAARRVYETDKFKNRGEFGELFLHAALRQTFNSVPAISKLYYKTAANDTVKGFDAVHVIGSPGSLELWLGEAKFYTHVDAAIRDVVAELKLHTETDYLRGEFILIKGKIDPTWPHARELEQLLSEKRSLDSIFSKACIAVLLTYDSECLASHTISDDSYKKAFEREIRKNYDSFVLEALPKEIEIHLFLLPLNTKKQLIAALDQKLKTWQII